MATCPFITTSMAMQSVAALQATVLTFGAHLISGATIGAASAFIAATYFVALTTTSGCYHYRNFGNSGTCHGGGGDGYLALAPRISERVHYPDRAKHRRGESQLY